MPSTSKLLHPKVDLPLGFWASGTPVLKLWFTHHRKNQTPLAECLVTSLGWFTALIVRQRPRGPPRPHFEAFSPTQVYAWTKLAPPRFFGGNRISLCLVGISFLGTSGLPPQNTQKNTNMWLSFCFPFIKPIQSGVIAPKNFSFLGWLFGSQNTGAF